MTPFEEIIDLVSKAFQSLMVAHGAALVACLSFLKDYATTPAYKEPKLSELGVSKIQSHRGFSLLPRPFRSVSELLPPRHYVLRSR